MSTSSDTALSFNDFTFIYGTDKTKVPTVSNISFELNRGEVLILAGPSGSGKSTLSYAINGLIPYRMKGYVKGDVKILGKSIWDHEFSELSKKVGLVKQNPLDQLVTFTVRDEISFGLENLKLPKEEIINKVEEISKFMGIHHLLDRNIDQLSGGQKQLTVLSSFLVMNPEILILDEPIAFLDQQSESLLLNRLRKLVDSDQFNLTIIIIEHRLSRVLRIADRIVILGENGKIHLNGTISEVLSKKFDDLKSSNVRVPWIIDIVKEFKMNSPNSNQIEDIVDFEALLTYVEELDLKSLNNLKEIVIDHEINPDFLQKLENYNEIIEFNDLYIESLKTHLKNTEINEKLKKNTYFKDNIILKTKQLTFQYPNSNVVAVNNLSIEIYAGDFIGLVGPNGSGKTTLLYLLANLYEPTSGDIIFKSQNLKDIDPYEYAKNIGFIFQNPENMIFKSTIEDEILYGPKNFDLVEEINVNYLNKLVSLIGNEPSTKNPFQLSWGQKRRLNLSSIFVYNPDIILLDEPFIGQDQKTINSIIETLYIENKRGKTIIISSHDYHLLLKYTKRIVELNTDGTLREFDMSQNYFKRHRNLGPVVLLEKINKILEGRGS